MDYRKIPTWQDRKKQLKESTRDPLWEERFNIFGTQCNELVTEIENSLNSIKDVNEN